MAEFRIRLPPGLRSSMKNTMMNTPEGEALFRALDRAEDELQRLDPQRYKQIEHWTDKDLYKSLYDLSGWKGAPEHKFQVMAILRARAAVYRGRKSGAVTFDSRRRDGYVYDSETGNEQMARTIDKCLEVLGEGPELPDLENWNDFIPEGFL